MSLPRETTVEIDRDLYSFTIRFCIASGVVTGALIYALLGAWGVAGLAAAGYLIALIELARALLRGATP